MSCINQKLLNILTMHPKAWPKLVLQNKFRQEIAFCLNRKTNDIWITNNKPKVDGKLVYGLIKENEINIEFFRASTPHIINGIIHLLDLYLSSPSQYAKQYGDTEHHCMYCKKKLTNPESILHGYGKICAGNYSLPWGNHIKQALKSIAISEDIKNKTKTKNKAKQYKFVQLEMEL